MLILTSFGLTYTERIVHTNRKFLQVVERTRRNPVIKTSARNTAQISTRQRAW